MTNVKLVTPYDPVVAERLRQLPVRIIDARVLTTEQVLRRIFHPYSGRVVILMARGGATDFGPGDLPVPEYVFQRYPLLGGDQLEGFILNNYGLRTHSNDSKTFYDVYMIWYLCRHIAPVRVSVVKMLMQNYGTTNVNEAAPWGDRKIGDMPKDGPERAGIMSVDLSFPVIIRANFKLVDGHHRLIRSALDKKRYIRAVVVSSKQLAMAKIQGIHSPEELRKQYILRFQ